jgi:hypothetical protein
MALYGWCGVLEAWFDDAKKGDMSVRLCLAGILTVAAVGVWCFLRAPGLEAG